MNAAQAADYCSGCFGGVGSFFGFKYFQQCVCHCANTTTKAVLPFVTHLSLLSPSYGGLKRGVESLKLVEKEQREMPHQRVANGFNWALILSRKERIGRPAVRAVQVDVR